MDAKFIMEYSPFELMYNDIRHTTVEKYAKKWNITDREIRILKERLLEEENLVYAYWLRNLPYCTYFKRDEDAEDNCLHLFYDKDAAEGYWYVGADALTTIARDLIYKVGNARKCVESGLFPALVDYTEELLILLDDYNERAVDYDEGKPEDYDTAAVLFGDGWRPTEIDDIFNQWPDTFESMKEFVSALKTEYISWIENKIAEMEDALGELDRRDIDYYKQYHALVDKCAEEITNDMIYNAGMGERKYIHHIRDYEHALCTEDGPDMYNRVLRILCQHNA